MDLESLSQLGLYNLMWALKFTPLGIVSGITERHYDLYVHPIKKVFWAGAIVGGCALASSNFGLEGCVGAFSGVMAGNKIGYEGYQIVIREKFIKKNKK